ncbi:glycoside hydrolase family 15 protein [Saccharopolyspora phatthalungensis]|uniref:Glycoside hydrolase n=1 Tax=Saccharopolyspora phatthalungensis TaxID=664693 RepID=A0A840QGQ9_9PSEU|nr:glycoside hydrolase family 15 protein [Saccharopolyspora phatthalungensis]MBB5159281.1 hypothetical protein [Saccharopolyspora phatthalungensis]
MSDEDAVRPHILREYSVLADGYRGAVCGPRGDIVWLCAPLWHDDAVFSRLLGGAGAYVIAPVEPFAWGGYYEPRSLIWRHRWVTTSTIVECRDALARPGQRDRVVLLRRIEAVEREVRLHVMLDVRAGFGQHPTRDLTLDDAGHWTADSGGLRIRWSGAPNATVDNGVLRTEVTVPAGGHHDFVLELSPGRLGDPVEPEFAWRSTETTWSREVPTFDNLVAPRDAQHACAVLRGLTVPRGGMVAAATMSLPERAEQGRNYDYRYTWIRDQCYAGIAAAAAGEQALLDDAVSFMTERILANGDGLRPAYTAEGGTVPDEQRLVDLPGYPGGQTVARGNRVTRQAQLDCYGELLQLLAEAARYGRLDGDRQRAVQLAVAAIGRHWGEPEAGLWELADDWWTHSRLACVAGLKTAARVAHRSDVPAMLSLADAILAETSRRCLHPDGHWQRSPTRTGPDAALLLPPVRGALPGDDPRTRATIAAVLRDLGEDGYLYRFRHSPQPLESDEGAFLLCGFFMALAENQQGNDTAAMRWFERNRAACGTPGLFAEEYDVRQRQLRGNLPQAFVHALLLESCVRLRRAA